MKFDRNTVLGFLILGAMFVAYFIVIGKDRSKYQQQQAALQQKEKTRQDSIAKLNKPKEDSLNKINDSLHRAGLKNIFKTAGDTSEKTFTVETGLEKITFTNKGGQIKKVELKNFIGPGNGWVKMAATDFDGINYRINAGANASAEIRDLFFSQVDTVKNADGSHTVSMTLPGADSTGQSVTHEFTVRPDNYLVDFTIKMKGAEKLVTGSTLDLTWDYAAAQQEKDISFEKQNTQVGYIKDGDFDYHSIFKRSSKALDASVKWTGVRQRFFFGALMAKDKFSSAHLDWSTPPDTARTVVRMNAQMKIGIPSGSPAIIPMSFYYGPSDYHELKKYGEHFEKVINLGQGMYSFVRPVNKFLIMPIFDLFKGIAGSMGLAIALLTLVIRLLISPLTYKSYLSGAKMKVLRPEIAALRQKTGGDQQKMSMEQMKLFREAGVNPLGGCIPALLQIPIFFALYSFFNSEIALRSQSFLWANDLSAYDTVIHFGSKIPLLGDHISLFNLTAVITSFLISFYGMAMSPDQSNPTLKYMPYIFPFFLLFIFNRLPSALTWYYTVSNVLTLAIQFVIQRYIIDHDKILAQIEENRRKPKTKSKWQERFEQMQDQQRKIKEMQQRNKR